MRNPEILNPFVILVVLEAERSDSGRTQFPIFQKSIPVPFRIIMPTVQE